MKLTEIRLIHGVDIDGNLTHRIGCTEGHELEVYQEWYGVKVMTKRGNFKFVPWGNVKEAKYEPVKRPSRARIAEVPRGDEAA